MVRIIDSDQHLYETRDLWADHVDPQARDDALRIIDDEVGNAWVAWRGEHLDPADVQVPGETDAIGARLERRRRGEPPAERYDDVLPDDYWHPGARRDRLAALGVDEAVLFPNYGLLWERRLGERSRPALLANMRAWNRWCATVQREGGGRLHPVGHLALADADWLERSVQELSEAGVRLAMVAPALVEGKPLSHPALDRVWACFVDHGVTPVFHVADQPRPFDDAWYTDADSFGPPVLEAVFLWSAPALAVTDLIVNGTLERHPDLRLGIVELGSVWVPMHLMMLDGGWDFTARLNGRTTSELSMRPSEYFRRQVRVSSFSYEVPERLAHQSGDLFMCCSDYPHSEGTATPVTDYAATARSGDGLAAHGGLAGGNVEFLLRRDAADAPS